MRTIRFLLQKEFRQIRRNKVILPIIFVLPIIQLLILVHATTFEIKNVNLSIVDFDGTVSSQKLINRFSNSSFFKISSREYNLKAAQQKLQSGETDMIVVIPADFGKDILSQQEVAVQFIPNAINSNFATLAYSYASNLLVQFNKDIRLDYINTSKPSQFKQIVINSRFWFNPELNYKWYMFPGIMVILISMIGVFISGLNLVREKEMGTIEQLNVTPIKKYQFIIGKLMPFLIIGIFELILATTIGRVFFSVPLEGSIWTLLLFTVVYLLVVLGIGLYISTISDTQQQMMFIAFFVVIIFILLSGIFTPIESMPTIVQKLNIINPIMHFMKVMRMVMLKGSGVQHLMYELGVLSVYAVTVLGLATWSYKKTS